jgi:hypothetical protein
MTGLACKVHGVQLQLAMLCFFYVMPALETQFQLSACVFGRIARLGGSTLRLGSITITIAPLSSQI